MKPIIWTRFATVGLKGWLFLGTLAGVVHADTHLAASPLFGRNLLVNGGGEQDQATPGGREVVRISGWTVEGNLTLVPYAFPDPSYGGLQAGSPVPPGAGINFFAGGPDSAVSSAAQVIDLAPIADAVDQGKVRFALAGYLGGYGGQDDQASLNATCYNAQGAVLIEAGAGPVTASDRGASDALLLRRTEGPVPAGTRTITVKLAMTRAAGRYNDGYADELAFELQASGEPVTSPPAPAEPPGLTTEAGLFDRNLIANSSGELDQATPGGREVVPISHWQVEGNATLVPYDAPDGAYGGIRPGAPIPPAAGRNFFAGGPDNAASSATQVIEVGGAAQAVDTGQLRYSLSGYFGGDADQDDQAELTAVFCRADGASLGQAKVGPVLRSEREASGGLLFRDTRGTLPPGTRSICLQLAMTRVAGRYNDGYADALALVLMDPSGNAPTPPPAATVAQPSPCPGILGDFLELMANGREDAALKLTSARFQQSSSEEKQAMRAMTQLLASARAEAVRVNAVTPTIAQVMARLRLASGDSAMLIATFHGEQLDQLDWRSHP